MHRDYMSNDTQWEWLGDAKQSGASRKTSHHTTSYQMMALCKSRISLFFFKIFF